MEVLALNIFMVASLVVYCVLLTTLTFFWVVKYAFLLFDLPMELIPKVLGVANIVESLSHIATVGVFALSIYMWRDSKRESKLFMALSMIDKTKVLFDSAKSYFSEQHNIYRQLTRVNVHISVLDESVKGDFVLDIEVALRAYLERLTPLDFLDVGALKNPLTGDLTKITIDVADLTLRNAILHVASNVYQYGVYGKMHTPEGNFLYWINAHYSANVNVLTKVILQAYPILRCSSYLEKDGHQWKQGQLEKLCLEGGLVPPMVVAFLYLCLSGKIHSILSQIEKINE
jgi:hypothetical protein